jgi:glucose/arabinose dehydrogenase
MFKFRPTFLGFAALTLSLGPISAFAAAHAANQKPCDSGNGGITLPKGFCATVFADKLGQARHMAVTKNGVVYVNLRKPKGGGSIVALKDKNHDGHADVVKHFGKQSGDTGIQIHNGYLYVASITAIRRYKLPSQGVVPKGPPRTIVQEIPQQSEHSARSFVINQKGELYLNSGAPSNACQKQDRVVHSKGKDPCPLLKHHGGVWRFKANKVNQIYGSPGHRFATGIRNGVAIAWNAKENQLYVVQMGRDQLHSNWPKKFTQKQGETLPAEEFLKVDKGDNFGWPYCYYDQKKHKNMLNPEYGGNGKKVGRCKKFDTPIMAFPAHWAPEGLLFYTGSHFPKHYRNGAFIAFHGSWNRAPAPQKGYKVVFVPFKGAKPSDHWQKFAGGFKGKKTLYSPDKAKHRPAGVAEGPHGALYISDDQAGRIWRVVYTGGSHANGGGGKR